MLEAITILSSYLLGAVPFAWLLGRSRGVDIRRQGSGNVGATNLGRVLGRRWALAAFALDFAKGLGAVGLASLASRQDAAAPALPGAILELACAGAAVLGHVFPVYLRFRGGKGVATTFGAMTALVPVAALFSGAVWLVLYRLTRTVSIASLAAGFLFPAGVAGWAALRGTPIDQWLGAEVFAIAVAILIALRHRENIRRLIRGEELAFRKLEAAAATPSREDKGDGPR